MLPDGAEPVCYRDGLVVKQNHQICDITNPKILSQLKERKPQATFSCDAASETCDFQCKYTNMCALQTSHTQSLTPPHSLGRPS